MKIRTDFVTNSSSTGYVVVTITTTQGTEWAKENYDTGYGGWIWNHRSIDSVLEDLNKVKNGEELYKVLMDSVESFEYFSQDVNGLLENIKSRDDLIEIELEEETRSDEVADHDIYKFRLKYDFKDSRVIELEDGYYDEREDLTSITIPEKKEDISGFFDLAEGFSFEGQVVCLTGDFDYGSKSDVKSYIEGMGGSISSSVSRKTTVVLMGNKGSVAWSRGNYGTKIEKAIERKKATNDICILKESKELFTLKPGVKQEKPNNTGKSGQQKENPSASSTNLIKEEIPSFFDVAYKLDVNTMARFLEDAVYYGALEKKAVNFGEECLKSIKEDEIIETKYKSRRYFPGIQAFAMKICDLTEKEEIHNLFKSIFTDRQIDILEKRFAGAYFLRKGYTYKEIQERTGYSSGFLSKTNRQLVNGANGLWVAVEMVDNQ